MNDLIYCAKDITDTMEYIAKLGEKILDILLILIVVLDIVLVFWYF